MADNINMDSYDQDIDSNVAQKQNQKRSDDRRRSRYFESIQKRAKKWYEDGPTPPNEAMFYLKGGEIITEGPEHMAGFLRDPMILERFKNTALRRPVNLQTVTVQAPLDILEDPEAELDTLVLPYRNPDMYTWDALVFLLPALLAREGIKGKNSYIEDRKPTWWPEDVRFCSPNSSSADAQEVVFGSTSIKEANYLFTCCEGIKLTRNSLRFIKDKLSDEIIDSYMLTLFRTTACSYEYIPCSVMSMMLNKRSQPAVIDHDFVSDAMGVYNIGRKHWVLIIIKLARKQFVVVDPLGELQTTLNSLFSSWVHYLKLKREDISTWNVSTLDHAKQQDSISCGVFCLMFAQKYVTGQTLDFDPDTVELFRSHILQTILENPDETLILKLCRICSQEEPRGRKNDKDIDWVGCERCGMYWNHFQCMGTTEPLCSLLSREWFCRFCS